MRVGRVVVVGWSMMLADRTWEDAWSPAGLSQYGGRNEKGGDGGGEHPLVCIAPSSMASSSMTSMAPTRMSSMTSTHQFGTSSPSGEVVSQRANGGPTHQSRDATYLPYLVPAHLPPDYLLFFLPTYLEKVPTLYLIYLTRVERCRQLLARGRWWTMGMTSPAPGSNAGRGDIALHYYYTRL